MDDDDDDDGHIYICIYTGCPGGDGGEGWDLLRRGRSGRAWRKGGGSSSSGGGSSCRSGAAQPAWVGSAIGPRLLSWCNWTRARPLRASTALFSNPPWYNMASCSHHWSPPPCSTTTMLFSSVLKLLSLQLLLLPPLLTTMTMTMRMGFSLLKQSCLDFFWVSRVRL